MPQDETTAQTVWVMQAWALEGFLSAIAWLQQLWGAKHNLCPGFGQTALKNV
jgi:hypothetical protein